MIGQILFAITFPIALCIGKVYYMWVVGNSIGRAFENSLSEFGRKLGEAIKEALEEVIRRSIRRRRRKTLKGEEWEWRKEDREKAKEEEGIEE